MAKNQIVIARYNEDLEWLPELLRNQWIESVVVYNKGAHLELPKDDRIVIRKVPNVGREGGTYLDHIIDNYEDLPEKTWFTQGNPLEHSPDFLGLMSEESVALYDRTFQGLSDRWRSDKKIPPMELVEETDAWRINGKRCVKYFLDNSMNVVGHCAHHDHGTGWMRRNFIGKYGDKHIMGHLASLAGIRSPLPITEFFYSACFYVHRDAIKSIPKYSYEKIKVFLYESDRQGNFQGYVLERFWPYLFARRSHFTVTDCYRDVIVGDYIAVHNCEVKLLWIKKNVIKHVFNEKNTDLLFVKDGRSVVLPGLNFVGPDVAVMKCEDLNEARAILRNFVASEKSRVENPVSRIP